MKQKTCTGILLVLLSMPSVVMADGIKAKIFSSSAGEKRMLVEKEAVVFRENPTVRIHRLINVFPELRYQKILGFGGAFTETAAYNFSLLGGESQQRLAEELFGETGIRINFGRTHINSSDFSFEEYTYVKDGDAKLETFTIDRERKWLLPMLKAAKKANPGLLLLASPWSPPAWMKDNKSMVGGGRLLPEHHQTWANYFALYFREFKKEGVDFFAVTIQNEAAKAQTWESCYWTGREEGEFAVNFLRPTLDANGFDRIKIMAWDHDKESILQRARETLSVPGAEKAIWGMAHHWYSGAHFDNLRMTHELYPGITLMATENSVGGGVNGGSDWGNVEIYVKEAIGNFNNFSSALFMWNLLTDKDTFGPFHNRKTGKHSPPVTVDSEKKEYTLGPTYYAQGHFSKFIKRGAVRIGSSSYNDDVKVAAFRNPDGEMVVVVLNSIRKNIAANIRLGKQVATFQMPAKSLHTLVIPTSLTPTENF